MRLSSETPGRRVGFTWLAAFAALLTTVLWLRPVLAQDATPMASPMAGTSDCTEPLGLVTGSACVNVIHASAEAPAVDVYVDGTLAITNLQFGQATGFVGLPAGEHQIQVAPSGGTVDEAVIDETLTLEAGTGYEIAATGSLDALMAAVNPVNLDPLTGDMARIRVIQTIPEAPAADVALAGGDVLIANVSVGGTADYAEVPAGATPVDLEIRPAGEQTALLTVSGASLQAGLVYSFYAIGSVSDPMSLQVLPVIAPASGSMMAGTPIAGSETIPLAPAEGGMATPMATPLA